MSNLIEKRIVEITTESLLAIHHIRYFHTERGFQGELIRELNNRIEGIFPPGTIAEQEYSKSISRHGTSQRPDIVLHVPAEYSGLGIKENNFAIFALKLNAESDDAIDDFNKMDIMFQQLNYQLGFFININSNKHHLEHYSGPYRSCIHGYSVLLNKGQPIVNHSFFNNGTIFERIEQ